MERAVPCLFAWHESHVASKFSARDRVARTAVVGNLTQSYPVASIPDEKVQEVRDKIDIADLVGRYVALRRAGRNFKGLCPFHQEKTPSFNVNPQRKGYKCFGCGAGGDGIRFVMEVEGKSFPEAVRKLGELYGVTLPASTGRSPTNIQERDEAYAILRTSCELYEHLLAEDSRAEAGRKYLQIRELTPEISKTFRLGYAPAPSEAGWDTLVTELGKRRLSLKLAERLGVIGRSERTGNLYDKFRGRLMFPIIAPGGEVLAFSGRIVPPHDEEQAGTGSKGSPAPKYVNSSESLLFTKGKQLFGLATARPAIRSKKRAILVEGNVDVVKLHQWGHDETIAPLGTALTPEQARLVSRFAGQVILCFDGDRAGKKAAWSALPLLLEVDLDVRMVLLPEGEDPDSIGEERFSALLLRAKPALEEMMIRVAAAAGEAAHARARGLDRLVPLIAHVSRHSARQLYVDRAAELFKLPAQRVEQALRQVMRGQGQRREAQENSRQKHSTSEGAVPVSAAVRPLPPLPAGQKELTMLLVDNPHLASVAERGGVLECVTDSRLAPLVRAIIDGAKDGQNPDLDDLLTRVDEHARRQVYDAVFTGQSRDLGEGNDPQSILHELVQRCHEKAIDDQIKAVEGRIAAARDAGYPDQVSQLSQERLLLRRQQVALCQQTPVPAGTPASN